MFLALLLYCALIFLMKYKTEIIRIKKKNIKKIMIQNFIYGWLRIIRMVLICDYTLSMREFLFKKLKTFKKHEKEFAQEIQELSGEKTNSFKKSKIASQVLASYNKIKLKHLMLPKKVKKRASLLTIFFFVSIIAVFLILKSLNNNILYFKSPTDIINSEDIKISKK